MDSSTALRWPRPRASRFRRAAAPECGRCRDRAVVPGPRAAAQPHPAAERDPHRHRPPRRPADHRGRRQPRDAGRGAAAGDGAVPRPAQREPERARRPGPDGVWVSVARIARRSTAPVTIWDTSGARLPRLTQHECGRLLAAGLLRLLWGILDSPPGAAADSELHLLRTRVPEAEWLLQHAIDVLVTERHLPPAEPPRPRQAGVVAGQGSGTAPSRWPCSTSTRTRWPSSSNCSTSRWTTT